MSKAVDRATAFINEVAGHGTYKIICKASNHDPTGPKKKHVDALLQITNNPHAQIAVLVDLVSERLKDKNWVVAFKTLIVSHNLMTLGHEKFMQCIATRSSTFDMELFADRTNALSITMSGFLRKYANYLICLCSSYRTMAMDVNRIPKGEDSPFKNLDPVKILKAAAIMQKQLDTLLEVDLTSSDLTNGVINTAFLMLYKDLVKLYAVYNDIMINLLEKFFEMKKPQCRETIEFYRRFLTRQEGVQVFLQLAEQVGIDKQTHLNLRQVPEDLLPALETHLSEMDTLKKSSSDASASIRAASETLAALKKTEKKPDPPEVTPTSPLAFPSASNEVLEAQRKRFEELKRQASIPRGMNDASVESSPLAQPNSSTTAQQSSANDLLGLEVSPASTGQDPWKSTPSASYSNPFHPVSTTVTAPPVVSNDSSATQLNDPWGVPQPSAYQEVDLFTEIRGGGSDNKTSFDAVFSSSPSQRTQSAGDWGGGILQPQAVGPLATLLEPAKPTVGLAEDVDSSLAMAAANLTMELSPSSSNKAGVTKKTDHQWTPAKESVKTGGNHFQKQTIQARTLPSHQSGPVQSGSMQPGSMQPGSMQPGGGGTPVDWKQGMYGGHFPQQTYPTQPMAPPTGMGYGMIPPAQPFGVQPMGAPMMPAGGWYPGQQTQPFQQPPQQVHQRNDPFGSIPSQNKSLF